MSPGVRAWRAHLLRRFVLVHPRPECFVSRRAMMRRELVLYFMLHAVPFHAMP